MVKRIFITNGMAGCGKDTFAQIMDEYIPTMKYSSIDLVKSIALMCGWNGSKTERDRKFLSDLKVLTTEYSDLAFNDIKIKVNEFLNDEFYNILLIDIREPKEIARAKKEFGASTILIVNDRITKITSNMADANVFNYKYDYVIHNDRTLEDFRQEIKKFLEVIFINVGLQRILRDGITL